MISFKRYLRESISHDRRQADAAALAHASLNAPSIDVKAVVWRGLQAAVRPLADTPLAPMWSRVPMSQAPSNLQTVLRHYVSRLPRTLGRLPYETLRRGAVAYVLDVEQVAASPAPLDRRRGRRGPPPSLDRAVIVEPVTGAVLVIPSIRTPQTYRHFRSTEAAKAVHAVMQPITLGGTGQSRGARSSYNH
jgi:hypothetical protein